MATQSEMRAWAKEKGISCSPKGSLDRDVEDMYLIDMQDFGVPTASLRAFTLACREWVHKNVAKLGAKERMNEIDIHSYMDWYTTNQTESVIVVPELAYSPPEAVVLMPASPDAGAKNVVPVAAHTPMQRIMVQSVTGDSTTVMTALSEADALVSRAAVADTAEESERLIGEALPIVAFVGGGLEGLKNTYHLMYCSGCGTHDNYTR